MNNKKSIGFGSRGWILMVYVFIGYFVTCAITNSVNLLAPMFAGTRGWNATLITSTYTIGTVIACVLQLFLNKILLKKSAKWGSIIFGIAYVIVCAIMCAAQAPWQFVVLYSLGKIFCDFWIFTENGVLVGNWFPRRKGTVMGVVTFGFPLASGIGMTIMLQLFPYGWFMAFLPFLVLGVIGVILAIAFLSTSPFEKGAYPDNDKSMTQETVAKMQQMEKMAIETSPWKVKELLKSKEFWCTVLPNSFLLFASVGMMTQVTTIMVAADAAFAAKYLSIVMTCVSIAACLGSWIIGLIDTKVGTKRAMFVSCILMIIAGVLMMTTNLVCVLIGIACMAFFMGAGSNFNVSASMEFWGLPNFSSVFSLMSPVANLISAFGPMVLAVIYAATGTYVIAFGLVVVMGIVGAILVLMIKKDNVTAKTEKMLAAKGGAPNMNFPG